MSRYGIHKRHTLDRLTYKYQVRLRELLKATTESQVREILRALEGGALNFHPEIDGILPRIVRIFDQHQQDVVHVGVSDGIQEVSPESELGLWRVLPFEMPIEDTLSISLAKKRDTIASKIGEKAGKHNKTLVSKSASGVLAEYLKRIRQAYEIASKNWLSGDEESSIEDVKDALKQALQQTDSAAERTFRTETTRYFNESRHEYFSDNTAVDYLQIFSIADGRRSKICEDRHGWVVSLDQGRFKRYMPPFHPHCRTIQRALISTLSTHRKIIEAGIQKRESEESSATPIAWKGAA